MSFAYLVGSLDKRTVRLVAVGIYSEEAPTVPLRLHSVVMASVAAASYPEARRLLVGALRSDTWQWIRPLLPSAIALEIAR